MKLSEKIAKDLEKIMGLTKEDKKALHILIIDFFAASYAGFQQNRFFNCAVEKIVLEQNGNQDASVFMQDKKYSASTAVFLNAIYAHGAELDDGNKKAMGHIGTHVIPAVFALAEKIKSTCEDVLVALAVGYEAYIRISSAAQPGMVQRGFHSTGMAGTLACAAACAKLYHLNSEGIENAIGLATTMSGGLLSYGDSRPAIKPLNPAKAAENGLFAAMLANQGIKGPMEALEGKNGWFHAVTEEYDETFLQGACDGHLLLHECYIKQYPSCRHTHCGIDAAIRLHSRVNIAEIKDIYVYIYSNAIKLAGQIKFPQNPDETKFSIHYTLACALFKGSYGIEDMNVTHLPDEIISLIDKIHLIPDESMENREKGIRGTKVEIVRADGSSETEIVLIPKGDPENPLTESDVINKLKVCANGQADERTLDKLVEKIKKMDGDRMFEYPL